MNLSMQRFCAVLAVCLAIGCTKETAAPAAAPPKVEAPKPALRNAAGKLTTAGVDAEWNAVFLGSAAANEPTEKKLAAFEARIGAPAKVADGKRVWWAFEGDACFKIELGPDGTKGAEKIFEPALCEK